jgi:hypothetical protein
VIIPLKDSKRFEGYLGFPCCRPDRQLNITVCHGSLVDKNRGRPHVRTSLPHKFEGTDLSCTCICTTIRRYTVLLYTIRMDIRLYPSRPLFIAVSLPSLLLTTFTHSGHSGHSGTILTAKNIKKTKKADPSESVHVGLLRKNHT